MKSSGYNLRDRSNIRFNRDMDSFNESLDEDYRAPDRSHRRNKKSNRDIFSYEEVYDEHNVMDLLLPSDDQELNEIEKEAEKKILVYRDQFVRELRDIEKPLSVLPNCVPINADVTKFDFDRLIEMQKKTSKICGGKQRLFDVIMMDPPWKLSSAKPSRGVAIQYASLKNESIEDLPINKLQTEGLLLIWTINAQYVFSIELMKKWGYKLIDTITWVKRTVNGKIAKGHGYYLQHGKETCLVGVKGSMKLPESIERDVIFSQRRGQSQKPQEIYPMIEKAIPNGFYLEIFGRRNNLNNNWVTIGNEL